MNNFNTGPGLFCLPTCKKGFLVLTILFLFNFQGNSLSLPDDCTSPSLPTAGSNAPVCAGSDINMTSSATGTAPFTYLWDGPNSFSSTDQNLTILAATTLSAGIYTVTISNACGFTSTTINIGVNAPVVSAITGTTSFSVGSTTQLSNATPGGMWWSSNTSVATINGSGLAFGVSSGTSTISYKVTDINSCTASATANVTVGTLIFDIGIFNIPANSNLLEITIKPLVNVVNGDYTAGVFTVRVPVAAGVSLTAPGILNSTLYNYVLSHISTDGTYDYYSFGFDGSYPPINWLVNTEHTIAILEHSGSCNGTGLFEIITPYVDGNINGGYYQELNGTDAQNVIYQPGAVAPLDIIPPTVSCPANMATTTDPGFCNASINSLEAVHTDNCPGYAVTFGTSGATSIASPPTGIHDISGAAFNKGITSVIYTIIDASGLTATCNFTITVTDNESPEITCNTPITVNNELNVCGASVTYVNISTDNCTGLIINQTAGFTSGSTFPVGTTTNSFLVTDAVGLTATCNFTITVSDNEAPSITCNTPITVNNNPNTCGAIVTFSNSSNDNCPGESVIQTAGLVSGSTFAVGITTNSFLVTDAIGLTNTCNFTITVIDNQAPTISCNPPITVNNDPNTCGAIVTFSNGSTDNCPGEVITQTAGLVSGSTFPAGITTNSFLVTDAAGLTATCNFTITLTDNEAPIIIAPSPITAAVNTGSCSAIVASLGVPIATDNCTNVSLSWVSAGSNPAFGTEATTNITFPLGNTTVTWTTTDASGNMATTTQIITVATSLSANSINLVTDLCIGASTLLSFSIAGGQGPYTIVYSTTPPGNNTTLMNYDSGDPILVNPVINTSYSLVSVTDIYDCQILSGLPPATVTINPLPSAPNTTATSCSGAPVGFNLQNYMNFGGGNGVNSNFAWYVISDNPLVGGEILIPTAGDIITNVLTNNTPFPQGVVYRITPTGDPTGCVGPFFDLTILVYPVPVAVAVDKTICSGTPTALTVTNSPAVFGSNFSWTADYGAVTGGAYDGTNPIANVAFGINAINEVLVNTTTDPIDVVYTITPAGSPPPFCEGPTITVVVTVIPTVGIPVVTGPAEVCRNDADAVYTAAASNNTGIVFSVSPVAAGVIHPVTGVMNWDAGYFGPVTITATATGCNGSMQSGTLEVTVHPLPVLVISQPAAVCVSLDLNTVAITADIAGGTYSYHATMADAVSNSNILSGAAVTAATFDTYVRYTLPTGCFTTGLIDVNIGACVQVTAKAMLQGPFNIADNTMFDNLRTGSWIPNSDPYSTPVYNTVFVKVNNPEPADMINAGVLTVTGNNAIADWVFVELRDKNNRFIVLATRAALIQRDGDIVGMDGMSPVLFNNMNPDQYYLAVRHRNHLGAMTFATVDYTLPSPPSVNYMDPLLPVFGANATKLINPGVMGLWAGNAQLLNLNSGKAVITYNGSNNDRLIILNLLGGNQLGSAPGYLKEDINMNGIATYNGSGNDRVIILNNLGGNQLGNITEQLLP